jgi:hypothetical protein
MKKRYIYSLLFGIPGLFVAGILSIVVFGGFVGILWLYVFGDNAWPVFWETAISVLFVLVVLTLWIGCVLLGYVVGKRLEKDSALNRNHVLISVGLTVMFILLILFQQWSVGNLGSKSDSLLCSDFCLQHGYSWSGMPPEASGDRICSCYDQSGSEALRIPLDHLVPDAPK